MTSCKRHPDYDGKRKPTNGCVDCMKLYLAMRKPRAPIVPTKTHKDKTKYTRKTKHKSKETE